MLLGPYTCFRAETATGGEAKFAGKEDFCAPDGEVTSARPAAISAGGPDPARLGDCLLGCGWPMLGPSPCSIVLLAPTCSLWEMVQYAEVGQKGKVLS